MNYVFPLIEKMLEQTIVLFKQQNFLTCSCAINDFYERDLSDVSFK